MSKQRTKRDRRVKRSRVYPPVRQQRADATPEAVAKALLRRRAASS